MSYSFDFPIVITSAGLQPQSPTSLKTQLTDNVEANVPDYTNDLPALLIDDVSSTVIGAISLCDAAKVELVNSLTPYGANQFLLNQLAQVYGLKQGSITNTSVSVVFTSTNIGFIVSTGYQVSDGTNVYQVAAGGAIGVGGTVTLTAVAVQSGSWSVPANTVTTIVSSIPPGITLSVNNPSAGTPGGTAETNESFQTRVLQAGLVACVGTGRMIKTLVANVPGVQPNLVGAQQASPGIRVIAGGSADQYAIAYAILSAVADPSQLVGSAHGNTNVTVSLVDYPDTYTVVYVTPPAQTITMAITWNTVVTNFTGGASFPGLVQQPLADYINALGVGEVINVMEMNLIFQQAIAGVLDPALLTRLVFSVSINGTPTPPATGTYAISGNAEGYFTCDPSTITLTQG